MGRKRSSEWTALGHKRALREERHRLLEPVLAAALAGSAELAASLQEAAVPLGWRRLLELAHYHGVAAVLLEPLEALAVEPSVNAPPAQLVQAARRQHALAAMQQRSHQRILVTLLEAFAAAQLKVVALKGPVLAERLWGGSEQRLSSDLDFLVAPQDVSAAAEVLAQHGYASASPRLTWASRWRFPDSKFEPREEAPAGAPLIELHWLAAYGCGSHLDTSRLLHRALPYTYAGCAPTWVLEPHDEFLALAIHGAKHQYERLAWLVDLVYRMRSEPPLELPTLLVRAKKVGALAVLAYTGAELKRLGVDLPWSEHGPARDVSLPVTLPRYRRPVLRAQRLAYRIHGLGEYRVPTKLWRMAFHLTLAQNSIRRLRYLVERAAAAWSRIWR